MDLRQFFQEHPKAALAFSGGADSAYLLWAARREGADAVPYFVSTPFQPAFERADARRLAEELGVSLRVVEVDVLTAPQVADNPANRCYYCKKALFTALKCQAAADGCDTIIDGTNASDDAGDRPGMAALRELEVLSPLRLCGLTKKDVRRLSRKAGLFTWDKPSYACLATRIPAGTPITEETLQKVERGEALLASMGFRDFRIRLRGGAAVIQVTQAQQDAAWERRKELLSGLTPMFPLVSLDLAGRECGD